MDSLPEENIFDVVVVGCGPAGLSAAINVRVRNKKLAVLGEKLCSPKLLNSPRVDNYLGFPGLSGSSLREKFLEHVEQMGIEILDQRVTSVIPGQDGFTLRTQKDSIYAARCVVLALGVISAEIIPGEEKYLGRGVSHCATCDAAFFKDKMVAVLSYQREGEGEARFLAERCRRVYYVPQHQNVSDFSEDNIEVVAGKPKGIGGSNSVEFLDLEEKRLQVDGVFIIRESVPADQLVPGLEMNGAFIKVDNQMRTNFPGVYAAGDCVGKPFQLAKAVGQGQVAALSAAKFL